MSENLNLSYNIPIQLVETFAAEGSKEPDFVIQGVAINSITTDNNHKFLAEELKSAVSTLKNRPLLKDHNDNIDSIVGKVIGALFNETDQNIQFQARINDTIQGKGVKELIKNGDLNTVSVGAGVTSLDEDTEEGVMIPRGIKFKELSFVATPADDGAQFTKIGNTFEFALQEAYEKAITSMEGERKQRGMSVSDFYAAPRVPPSSSSLPIFDAAHTRNAMARFSQTKFVSQKEKISARNAILKAAKKFGINADNFKSETQSYSSDIIGQTNINKKEDNMEKDEKAIESTETIESENNTSELAEKVENISDKVKSQTELLTLVLAEVKSLKESDVDEVEVKEEPKEEIKEPEEVKPEEKVETKVEPEEEESEGEEDSVDEHYKIVQGHKYFSIVRNKY